MVARMLAWSLLVACLVPSAGALSTEDVLSLEGSGETPPRFTVPDAPAASAALDPSAPVGLVVHPTVEGARLVWQPPAAGTPSQYVVYRSTDGGEAQAIAATTNTTFTDASVLSRDVRIHVYQVRASFEGGPPESPVLPDLGTGGGALADLPSWGTLLSVPASDHQGGGSNPGLYVSGPVTHCMIVRVDPQTEPEPDVDFGINERFLECITPLLPT